MQTPPLQWSGLAAPRAELPRAPRAWWRAVAPDVGRWGAPAPAPADRVIFDLCAGSGAWSQPYVEAGYIVVRVTLPFDDVRTWVPPCRPWGVLCAPPCNEFSRANRSPRDYVEGMAAVNACLRVVAQTRPIWWAVENPHHGDLAAFLGPPQWSFEPYEFGDPWRKPTALWGEFMPPTDRQLVTPLGAAIDRSTPAARARTPPGFARAFFAANG